MVYFSSTINPEGATYAIALRNVNGMKLLKDSYSTIMLDGHHRCRSVNLLKDEYKNTTELELRISGWQDAHSVSSGAKIEQNC